MSKLTIGMAHFDDFEGLWGTVQALRIIHSEVIKECEILVVDNHPQSPHGKSAKDLIEGWVKADMKARYIPYGGIVGTSASRDLIFREADSPYVMCMDCHIMIFSGAVQKLINYYEENPDTQDLLTGPLVYDDFKNISTHFDDQWRDHMWGTWGHDERGEDPNGPPFEIGAMGLGVFSCKKDAWQGFNPDFRGFGGEEWYIHEKFRQAGAKCLCLPFLRWAHRFGRPGGSKYPVTVENKIRNYILGHKELGLSLVRPKNHFLENGVDEVLWNAIENGMVANGTPDGCGGCGKEKSKKTMEELYKMAVEKESDINFHCPKLKELASQCNTVVEFGKRHTISTVALLCGKPKRLISYADHMHPMFNSYRIIAKDYTEFVYHQGDSLSSDIEETDMLFIDTKHNEKQLTAELSRHANKVKKWIVMHDTEIHGEKGDDGEGGLLVALRKFMTEHHEWSVIYHSQENNGLTVISRDPADKPKIPSTVDMGTHFVKAFLNHIVDGMKKVSHPQLKDRLIKCILCEQRTENRCAVCGCFCEEKAAWRSEECPLGKWPNLDQKEEIKEDSNSEEKWIVSAQ